MLVLTASGTGGLEAALANLISPGDKVLSLPCGAFGKRWADIASAFGANVVRVEFAPGQAIDPQRIIDRVQAENDVKLIIVTHNETSTGVSNDVAALSHALQKLGDARPLLAVDAISSLGAVDLPMDALQIDALITASQKAFMAPPGLSLVALSPRGWNATAHARSPRYYWDLRMALASAQKNVNPFTPAVGIIFALSESLRLMLNEGLPAIFERHRRIGEKMRAGVHELGLDLFADHAHASNTVTAVRVPEGIKASELIARLVQERGVEVAGGMGYPIFRVGHMGFVTEEDIEEVLNALGKVLNRVAA